MCLKKLKTHFFMKLTKELRLDLGIAVLILAVLLFVVFSFAGCSDNGDHYNTPKAQVLTPQQYPLNKWRQDHEQPTLQGAVYGFDAIKDVPLYTFWK
jgi:hypothetical protein